MAREHATDEELSSLFDLIASKGGQTILDIAAHLGVRVRRAQVVVHDLRQMFGHDDTVNLVCDPQGQRELWLYDFRGTLDGVTPWTGWSLAHVETRLETLEAVAASIERAADGRTIEGRRARILARAIRRAREDLADLNGAA